MGKISNEVSKGLDAAIKEAQAKMTGNNPEDIENVSTQEVETLLNSGAEAQRKRKRRTKTEIETEDNSLFESLLDIKTQEKIGPMTYEQACERDLQNAVEKGLENPDFDFRNFYEKGQTVWFVQVFKTLGTKEMRKLYLRTIYPRLMVGSEEKAYCQCIGYDERNMIFLTQREAQSYYDSIEAESKKDSDKPNNRKRKYIDEGVEYTYDEEVMEENDDED